MARRGVLAGCDPSAALFAFGKEKDPHNIPWQILWLLRLCQSIDSSTTWMDSKSTRWKPPPHPRPTLPPWVSWWRWRSPWPRPWPAGVARFRSAAKWWRWHRRQQEQQSAAQQEPQSAEDEADGGGDQQQQQPQPEDAAAPLHQQPSHRDGTFRVYQPFAYRRLLPLCHHRMSPIWASFTANIWPP